MKAAAFFGELKRRNVLRAGALYAAAVWALSQGLAQLLPLFGDYNWIARWFLIACIIGFPFWLAFAWFYELTPGGLKRESQIAPEDSITQHTGKKFDRWIIAVLVVAVVLLATNTFVLHHDVTSAASAATAKTFAAELAKVPDKSVAVLPLANESGNPKQQYFVDGMSEELISDLTQINGLKVIGKDSSFKFRDSKDSPAQIGAALGVAHLIQGSVFQQGDRIRVAVSMIRAKDGSSVWSHSYDEPLKDVFAIQTKVGHAVATALKVKLLGQTLGIDDKPPSGNVEAYQLMLQGRALIRRAGSASEFRQGIALYQQALTLDPNYAYAWGNLSNAWANLGGLYLTGDAQQQAYAQARVAMDKQQLLAPDAADTLMDRGALLGQLDHDPVGALAEYKRAYALAPNNGNVMNFLAGGYQNLGQLQPAAELYRKAIATDPLRPDFYYWLATTLLAQGQLDAAEQATRKALALQPDFPGLYVNLANIDIARGQLDAAEQAMRKELALHPHEPGVYANLTDIDILRGDAAAAVRNAKQETDPVGGPWSRAMAQQINPDRKHADAALYAYLAKYGKTQPYGVADLYALRKQPDEMFGWLQRALKQRDSNFFNNLLIDPLVLAYQHDPRFAALCKQAGLPLPGRPLPASSSSGG
ncbi:MAG: tetratricopeptide repeat protein [Rhodanobacteraceae bacterium]